MVATFQPDHDWFMAVLPDGLPLGETTTISGPGGSGKPLVGFAVVESWLRQGGDVLFLLVNSGRDFAVETMQELYDFDVSKFDDQLVFVDFDPTLDTRVDAMEMMSDQLIRANLLSPAVWNEALSVARTEETRDSNLGTLVFGTALNLFLFSPTYGGDIREAFIETASREDDTMYLFTVSTSAFEDEIAAVENASDTVLFTEMGDGRLSLRGVRSDSVSFREEPVTVPFTAEQLDTIKSVSEETRTSLIPTIKKI